MGVDISNPSESEYDFSPADVLYMLRDLPDACCVFKVLTDHFGTVQDMQFVFANEKYATLVGRPSAELIGATYYTTVTNRDEDWIRLSYQAAIMRQSVINRTYNTHFSKWFEFWAVPVYKKGFCAFIIHDVTAEKRKEETREIKEKSNHIIIECAKILSENEFKKGIRQALNVLGTTLDADRAFLVEVVNGEAGEIYEWSAHAGRVGLPAKKEFEKFDFFTMWNKQLNGENVVIVEDTIVINERNSEVYKKVLEGNISTYMLAAIKDKSDTIGYVVIDNFSLNLELNTREILESVAIFFAEEMRNNALQQRMEYLNTHDVLTDVGNRYAYNTICELLKDSNVKVGVCFVDINGLKYINDINGHNAGDDRIREVSEMLSTVFKKKFLYRIGGDEFVAILPQVEKDYFAEMVEKLRKKAKKLPVAVGAVWNDSVDNLEELVKEADKLMYADKADYYTKNDRRNKSTK